MTSLCNTENESWRNNRNKKCRDPDGWLSLAGLHFLSSGDNTVGGDPSNNIRFEVANSLPFVGTLNVNGDTVAFTRADSATDVRVDGREIASGDKIVLSWSEETPTVVTHDGTLKWFIIKRGSRFAVRLRDANNQVLRDFAGIDMWPIDEAYRVRAKFEPFQTPKEVTVLNASGDTETDLSFGLLRFSLHGVELSLQPLHNPAEKDLFIVFGDKTTGKQSYGGGRMLYVKAPVGGEECIVDFNQSYNPPVWLLVRVVVSSLTRATQCVFTPYCTCPLPIKENKLPVPVEAGEKSYHGYS
jgi:uncharacterized protein (DUF1684 family)